MPNRKIILYSAASLDGFIATESGGLDWLFSVEGEGDNGYGKFYGTIDTILLGRVTYDWIMSHEERFPYKGKECYVFSKKKRAGNENVAFVNGDAAGFIKELKEKSGGDIWLVGGGTLNNLLLNENLIDEIILTVAPVMLGIGIPLFKGNAGETRLSLKKITRYNQLAELHYTVEA